MRYYKRRHRENCVKTNDISSIPAQSHKVFISETNDVQVLPKKTNRDLILLRVKNSRKLIIQQLNIRDIKDNVDILMITKTKLDERFSIDQCFVNGFSSPFCLDRDKNSVIC